MRSASELIEALGGSAAVAAAMDLPYTTVASWKARGYIPSDYWSSLIQIAREKRITGITSESLLAGVGNRARAS